MINAAGVQRRRKSRKARTIRCFLKERGMELTHRSWAEFKVSGLQMRRKIAWTRSFTEYGLQRVQRRVVHSTAWHRGAVKREES